MAVTRSSQYNFALNTSHGQIYMRDDGTIWKDISFAQTVPKATGAGNPTLVTWNGNLRGYTYAVGDANDFDPQEFQHDGLEGSMAEWHVHFVTRSTNVADRFVNFQIEYSQADRLGVFPAPTTVSAELTIPGSTPVMTHMVIDIASLTTAKIASMMYARMTRIAASGTAPASDPLVAGLHYHYQLDSLGSRKEYSK